MQKMLVRNPAAARSARLLMSTAFASYAMYHTYNRYSEQLPSLPSQQRMLAEAEPVQAKQDPYTRSRDK